MYKQVIVLAHKGYYGQKQLKLHSCCVCFPVIYGPVYVVSVPCREVNSIIFYSAASVHEHLPVFKADEEDIKAYTD